MASGTEAGPSSGTVPIRCTKSETLPHCCPYPLIVHSEATEVLEAVKILTRVGTAASSAFPPLQSCSGGIKEIIDILEVRFYRTTS